MTYDEEKFREFNVMLADMSAADGEVIIADPTSLGDDYGEIIENLNRLADAKVTLRIVPRGSRS